MNIIPLYDLIFIKPDELVNKTKGGIILTDFSKKRPASGVIIAIGSRVQERKIGERVSFGEFCGQRITINWKDEDTEILVVREKDEDILALLE
jgi:chaperonin GroES